MAVCTDLVSAATEYFDALHRGDAVRLGELFLPDAHLYAVSDDKAAVMPIADYLDLVANRPSPKSAGHSRSGNILAVDLSSPSSAVAKVTVNVPPARFVDILSFLKLDDRWRIAAKVYHLET